MFEAIYGQNKAVADFVATQLGFGLGFGECTAIGFGWPLVAGVVYHNWNPEAGVIELSAASTRRDWLSRANLRAVFDYPFGQLGCQLCVARMSEHNHRARRIWRALGANEYIVPRLRGRNEAEAIATLTVETWQKRNEYGQAKSTGPAEPR